MGLGGVSTGQDATTYANFPGFTFSDTVGGGAVARYNFSNGWFVGSERSMAFGTTGLSSAGAFGGLRYEGTQFGYNFQNSPVTVFGGFGSLKYDSGLGTALSSPFANPNSTSAAAGYSSRVGVEFRPTSNLSLSFGASYTQQGSGLVDSDIHSDLPPGASPLAFGRR